MIRIIEKVKVPSELHVEIKRTPDSLYNTVEISFDLEGQITSNPIERIEQAQAAIARGMHGILAEVKELLGAALPKK